MPKPTPHTPRVTLESITVEDAYKYLESMSTNRIVNQSRVKAIARDIATGKWRVNGDCIRFDWDNHLIDGQHRLWAIIEAKKPIRTYIMRDLDPATMETIDIGKSRSFSDHLEITGHKRYARVTAAAIQLLWREHATGSLSSAINKDGRLSPSQHELNETLRTNPSIIDSVARCAEGRGGHRSFAPHGTMAWLHHHFKLISQEEADAWARDLITGDNLTSNDAVYRLRERLIGNAIATKKMGRLEIAALMIKSWNYRRSGKECRNLRWQTGTEPFPDIRKSRRRTTNQEAA